MWRFAEGISEESSEGAAGPLGNPPDHEDVAEWVKRRLRFEPDATQRRVLNSRSRRVLLNCTRQWGKSTIGAAKTVHHAFTRPERLIVVVTPTARQSGEFVRKAAVFAQRLRIRPKGDGDNEVSLAFPNGSRIVGLAGKETTVRGFSAVSLLLMDEAARVSDELYLAVRPMLAVTQGTLWLISTPFGKRGFFYETWVYGGKEWDRVRVPAEECPRISRRFLNEERKTMDARWYRREYQCEFEEPTSRVFDPDLIETAVTSEVKPLFPRRGPERRG